MKITILGFLEKETLLKRQEDSDGQLRAGVAFVRLLIPAEPGEGLKSHIATCDEAYEYLNGLTGAVPFIMSLGEDEDE